MIEDNKLQAVSFAHENLTINYGSKEDDNKALHTISELLTSEPQDREIFVSEIVKSMENMSEVRLLLLSYECQYILDCVRLFSFAFLHIINLFPYVQPELSSLREDLLKEFSLDDMCPLGFPLTIDMPEKVCLVETDYILILCLYMLVNGY